jgi:hypothetical protein
MRPLLIALLAAAAPFAAPAQAPAQDSQADTPLAPGDAAGPWTLEASGHSVCVLGLSRSRTGGGAYGLHVPADCADVLPPGVTGWAPTSDGMSLVTAEGRTIRFERWSNSLLVAGEGSGLNLALRRGAGEG